MDQSTTPNPLKKIFPLPRLPFMEANKAGQIFRRRNRKQSHPRSTFHNPIKEEWEERKRKRKLEALSFTPRLVRLTSSDSVSSVTRRKRYLFMMSHRRRARRLKRGPFIYTSSSSCSADESSISSSDNESSGGGGTSVSTEKAVIHISETVETHSGKSGTVDSRLYLSDPEEVISG